MLTRAELTYLCIPKCKNFGRNVTGAPYGVETVRSEKMKISKFQQKFDADSIYLFPQNYFPSSPFPFHGQYITVYI